MIGGIRGDPLTGCLCGNRATETLLAVNLGYLIPPEYDHRITLTEGSCFTKEKGPWRFGGNCVDAVGPNEADTGLFEGHPYSDAIPLDLLKTEQASIAKRLAVIENDIKMHNTAFEEIHSNLSLAFDLIQDCGLTYRQANDATKRLLNQAIFKGFYIYNEDTIKAELAEPFDQILPPIMDDIARVNHAKSCNTNCLAEAVEKAKGHIQTISGCGSSFGHNKSPYPNESFF